MRENNVTLKIAGEAGYGIATMGAMFAKLMQRSGLYVFGESDYPSLIRGGHNTMTIRASDEKIYSLDGQIDILIALNKKSVHEHIEEMTKQGIIIYDSGKVQEAQAKISREDVKMLSVPLTKIADEAGGQDIYFSQVAMGALMALLKMKPEAFGQIIEQTFEKKGKSVIMQNKAALLAGHRYVMKNDGVECDIAIRPKKNLHTLLLGANDAACLGSVKAGVRLIAEYPMSPSSSVLHWMAANAKEHDIVVKHTEDEIAAMNYILGAGFAGVRAMTATSGGGFSLMAEALGNGGMAEIPCVVINVQRCGPSTALPTYTEQADLQFVLHASQGEFPRIVCMPGDVEEAFYETFNVWNMCELAQTPAIILLDKYVGESIETVKYFDLKGMEVKRGLLQTDEQMESVKDFLRYKVTQNGISPRCLPGQKNGIHVCSSYEHDETGFTSEDPNNRIIQIDKRARKLSAINPNLYQPAFYGNSKSTILAVSWGSTKGPVLEALKKLKRENIEVRFMHIKYASPFATDTIRQALQSASKAIIFEGNSEGQMRNLIREKTGIMIENLYCRYDGRPFVPDEIVAKIKEVMEKE